MSFINNTDNSMVVDVFKQVYIKIINIAAFVWLSKLVI